MRKKPKERKLNPRIIEKVNSITGETKWTVWKDGLFLGRGPSMPPWSRDFDTREEAIACFADNFGWRNVGDFQPTEDDVHVLGIQGDRASG